MSTRTLLSDQAGNATSAAIRVKPLLGNSVMETVLIRGYGTWNGATVTLKVSDDANNSPPTWTGLTSETGTAVAVFTADFAVNIEIPSGLWFRAEVSGSGSPQSSLTIRATGDLEAG